jgi:hypothetical protein
MTRIVLAFERAGKLVCRLSVHPDGGFDLIFSAQNSTSAEELDLVKMAKQNG